MTSEAGGPKQRGGWGGSIKTLRRGVGLTRIALLLDEVSRLVDVGRPQEASDHATAGNVPEAGDATVRL